jgi:hypothetical protein
MTLKDLVPRQGVVVRLANPENSGLAAVWWKERSAQPCPWSRRDAGQGSEPGPVFFQNIIALRRANDHVPMQAGIAAVTIRGESAGWTSNDFFVPPSLWGAGIGSHFLDGLLVELSKAHARCVVVVKAPPPDQDHQVARDDARSFIEQYRKAGFRQGIGGAADLTPLDWTLLDALGFNRSRDTLLVLDLKGWINRRNRT